MRTQPAGSQVTLDAMMVDEIGDGFLIVREPFDQQQRVRVQAYARVKKWQSVEVTGTVSVAESSEKYLSDARVLAYADAGGIVIVFPLPKWLDPGQGWPYKVDVTSDSPIPVEPEPPAPQLDVEEGTIGWAKLQANGAGVQLAGKVVAAVFQPSGADKRFFYIEEPDRSSGIRVYPPPGVSVESGWIVTVSGVVQGGFAGWETRRGQRDWNANETIIEAPSETVGSVVTAEDLGAAAGIDGFTIRNGYTHENGAGICCVNSDLTIANNRIGPNDFGAVGGGGGIYCSGEDAQVNIWDNTIGGDDISFQNSAQGDGGGVCCVSCAASIIGNAIKNNSSAGSGGGICCWGTPSPTISENEIASNYALYGGGVGTEDSSPTLSSNAIEENVAFAFGGGIYGVGGRPVIEHNTILLNSVEWGEGGGIGCDRDCPAQIIGNRFEENDGNDHGGGISLEERSNAYIANNLFIDNHADDGWGGGGINVYGGSQTSTTATIVNNTFVDNTATYGSGGAVLSRYSGYAVLTNNIFSGNQAACGNSVAATQEGAGLVTYCLAYPGDGDANYYQEEYSTLDWSSATNLYFAPLFVGADDYHLALPGPGQQSPIDKGLNSAAPETDFDGAPRPVDITEPDIPNAGSEAYADMGAYERQD